MNKSSEEFSLSLLIWPAIKNKTSDCFVFAFEFLTEQIDGGKKVPGGELNVITFGYLSIFSTQLRVIHERNIEQAAHKCVA